MIPLETTIFERNKIPISKLSTNEFALISRTLKRMAPVWSPTKRLKTWRLLKLLSAVAMRGVFVDLREGLHKDLDTSCFLGDLFMVLR